MKKSIKKVIGSLFAIMIAVGSIGSVVPLTAQAALDAASSMPSVANKKVLVGYWHNWKPDGADGYQRGTSTYLNLNEVPKDYNVVNVSFMKGDGTSRIPTFKPAFMTDAEFRAQVGELNAQGRVVQIALGGADAHIELKTGDETALANEIIRLVETYGFDGLDIDLEQAAITAGDNQAVLPAALKAVKNHYAALGQNFMITMAPEFPYLKPNAAYAKYISALDGYYDFINPQFYNQGGDGVWVDETNTWLTQNNDAMKADFLFYMVDSLNHGTRGYLKIPADKLVIGIPANNDGAATGYVKDPQAVFDAFARLEQAGEPVKGLMTWSVNWDIGKDKTGKSYNYEFVNTYGPFLNGQTPTTKSTVAGTISDDTSGIAGLSVSLYNNATNQVVQTQTTTVTGAYSFNVPEGSYYVKVVAPLGFTYKTGTDTSGKSAVVTTKVGATSIIAIVFNRVQDMIAPSAPTSLVASTITSSAITVNYPGATDNIGVSGYEITLNGGAAIRTSSTSYTFGSLNANITYTIAVVALDAAGNRSTAVSANFKTSEQTVANWDAGVTYGTPNTKVLYQDNIYQNKYYVAAGTTPNVDDRNGDVTGWVLIGGPAFNQVPEWSSNVPYQGGAIVKHNNKTWKAKWYSNAGSEPGVAAEWELQ